VRGAALSQRAGGAARLRVVLAVCQAGDEEREMEGVAGAGVRRGEALRGGREQPRPRRDPQVHHVGHLPPAAPRA